MKLYMVWDLFGKVVTSPRPAIKFDLSELPDVQYSSFGPTPFQIWWMLDPARAKMYMDLLEQMAPILGMAAARKEVTYTCMKMLGYFLAKEGVVVTGGIIPATAAAAKAGADIALMFVERSIWVELGIGMGLTAVVWTILLIVNPKLKLTRKINWQTGRYMMRYQENFWWADLVGCTRKGTDLFYQCGSIPCMPMEQTRGKRHMIMAQPMGGDTIHFGGTWVEEGWNGPIYETIIWEKMTCSYVGFLVKLGAMYYKLQEGFDRTFMGDPELGYMKPVDIWCSEPQREVEDYTL